MVEFMYHPHSGSALENNQGACIIATVDACLVPESPVVLVPVRRNTPPLVQRYLNVFLRYAGIGIIGTTAHFVVLFLMVGLTIPVVASTLGAITGCVTNFRLSRFYVFAAQPGQLFIFPKFATIAIGGIAINATVIFTLTPLFPLIISQIISSGIVLVTGFLLNSAWSFGELRN